MKKITVTWLQRPVMNQVYNVDDIEISKTGTVASLIKDGEVRWYVSNFQQILIEEIEE